MRWQGGRRGGGVEDRRGMGGGAVAGGGIGVLVLAAIGYFVFGIDPNTTQQVASQFGGVGAEQQQGQVGTPEDQAGRFVDVIGANINDVWAQKLNGYQPPKVVIYEQGTSTGCGFGQSAMGPFYCPGDSKVYLDLDFFDVMHQRLGAPGDFAQAYVIAHEVGHHVQNLVGTTAKMDQMRQRLSEAQYNAMSVRLELQADCYAGVWAHHAQNSRQIIEAGDVEEALNAAAQIGDDTLQSKSGGPVSPESFTHGTSEQRMTWFKRGMQTGDINQCNTFDKNAL